MGCSRDDVERAFPEARHRRGDLRGELLRYCLVCGILFVFLPPLGWAVAFFWGIGLARRALAARRPPRLPRPAPNAKPRLEELRIEDLVDATLEARADRIARGEVALYHETDVTGALRGDPALLGRALGELLDHALGALEAGPGPRRLAVEVGENLAGTAVWVRIGGSGDGRSGEPAPGALLDLASPRKIAEAHGGTLEANASPEIGFELLLTLPKPPV